MRIFLTGASGFVGGHALQRLLRGGHQVLAAVRSPVAAQRLAAAGAEVATGPMDSLPGLATAMAGCQAVVHCAAHLRMGGPWAAFEAGNLALTRRLLQAANAAGVQRFVHISAASVVMQAPAPLRDVDETAATTRRADLPYSSTKAAAEALVLAAAGPGLQTLALRPPLVWGPGDTVDGLLGQRIASGRFGWFDGGHHPYATCHVDNLCEAVSLALQSSASGIACFVTDGDAVDLRGFLSQRIAARGLAVPTLSVPTRLAWHAAGVLERLWRLGRLASEPPLSREAVRLLGCPFTVRSDRARQALAYWPVVSIDDGLRRLRARAAASLPPCAQPA